MYEGNTLQWLTTLLSTQKLVLQVSGHRTTRLTFNRTINMLNYLQSVHPTLYQLHHIIILPPRDKQCTINTTNTHDFHLKMSIRNIIEICIIFKLTLQIHQFLHTLGL
jgi:hypothetical protein